MKNILCGDTEVITYLNRGDFSNASKKLLELQIKSWSLAEKGYKSLESIQTKTFHFEGFDIKVQFNPGRIISSSAKVDEKSIKERECFLCIENLPIEQKGLLFNDEYLILVNPFPIFPEHFTLPNLKHIPQRIHSFSRKNPFSALLDFSKNLSKFYTVFYNGPNCGASAPDHLHFQAGLKNFIPIEADFHQLKKGYGEILFEDDQTIISAIDDGLRRFISFESLNKKTLIEAFEKFYDSYKKVAGTVNEPMMNILSLYEEKKGWRIIIFLRNKHRPSVYFADNEKKIVISPASVDLGGICITPREKDFINLDKKLINEILNEVSIPKEKFNFLSKILIEKLK